LVEHISNVFIPSRIIFYTNVNGIYDLSKLNKSKPKLIKQIDVNQYGKPIFTNIDILKQIKNPKKYYQKHINNSDINHNNNNNNNNNKSINDKFTFEGGLYSKINICSKLCAQGFDVTITKGNGNDSLNAILGRYTPNSTLFVKSFE